jgi:predicted house-cleaning noncanonical NTP pyrophosphatase (MazG superfamily)
MTNFYLNTKELQSFITQCIAFNLDQINLNILIESFYQLLKVIKTEDLQETINLENIIFIMHRKIQQRGGFTKNMILEYLLISASQNDLLNKYFNSPNNLFAGKILMDNQEYYKFYTYKAIRDNNSQLRYIYQDDLSLEKNVNFDSTPIGKIIIANHEIFYNFLKIKLIEEAREVYHSLTLEETIEELADVYTVITTLQKYP